MKENGPTTTRGRNFAAIAATALVASVLVACGGGSSPEAIGSANVPAQTLFQNSVVAAAQPDPGSAAVLLAPASAGSTPSDPLAGPANAVSALDNSCMQITGWSKQDTAFFPVPRVTREEHYNTPGRFYFPLDGTQEKQMLVTYFSFSAGPSLTKDRLFANSVGVSVSSFASRTDAAAMFDREIDLFNQINPVRWNYRVLFTGLEQLSYYDEQPGDKLITLLRLHGNSIIQITLRSASASEDTTTVGAQELDKRAAQAVALVDSKCIAPIQPNRPPTISLSPDPAAVPAFQELMTLGNEFEIRIDDADGVGDVDLSTFQVWVAGVDKTRHFLETAAKRPSRLRQVGNTTGTSYFFRPDPRALMVAPKPLINGPTLPAETTDTNYFNIQWNGNWPVSIGICDRHGACARANYTIYFGPYLATRATFLGNASGTCVGVDKKIQFWYVFGNSGYDSDNTDIYFGLLRVRDGAFWTIAPGQDVQYRWRWNEIKPALTWRGLESGFRATPLDQLALDLETDPASKPFTTDEYRLVMLPLDPNSTDNFVTSAPAFLCPP